MGIQEYWGINLSNVGLRQGYFIGLFARFIWFLIIYSFIQSIIIYVFDINWFTYWVTSLIFSFFINTSLPMREDYPFFRHAAIYFSLLTVVNYIEPVLRKIYEFYTPSTLWIVIVVISFLAGTVAAFGKSGSGTSSTVVEGLGNLFIIITTILSFVFFWWEGGVMFVILRMPLFVLESFVGNAILYLILPKVDMNETENI